MTCLLNPSTWIALFTLILLEIILGIDNLIFITILSEKLSPKKREKARLIGLGLSVLMRLILLSIISWMMTLTNPILNNKYFNLSGRDVILLLGGLFLVFKATIELHEKLENNEKKHSKNKNYSDFWIVIIQIVILDTVFSIDSVITAAGIVNQLLIMIFAVIFATMMMVIASKPLSKFLYLHKTIIILCLSFLIMIGLSLISESLGLYIPKGYIYVAIGFSILIEIFNQIALNNIIKNESLIPIRQRAIEIIFSFMKKKQNTNKKKMFKYINQNDNTNNISDSYKENFQDEEKYMINGVLTLAYRSIRSIMTPRSEISWINIKNNINTIKLKLLDTPHNLFPICKGELDEIVGIMQAKELLFHLDNNNHNIEKYASKKPPIIVLDTLDTINLIKILRTSKGNFVIVTNEFGIVQGLITPLDVLEAIAGEFPDSDETPDIIIEKNSWLVKGNTDIYTLGQILKIQEFLYKKKNYSSLSGLLISKYGKVPKSGDIIQIPPLTFNIISATEYQINLIRIIKH